MKSTRMNDFLLISAALATLILGFIFDSVLRTLAPEAETSMEVTATYALLTPLFELLLMVAVVGVIWMFLAARRYGRLVSAAFLILGLLGIYFNALLLILPFPDSWYVLTIFLAPGTYTFQAAGALAGLGLVSLWFWQPAVKTPVAAKPEPVDENLEPVEDKLENEEENSAPAEAA